MVECSFSLWFVINVFDLNFVLFIYTHQSVCSWTTPVKEKKTKYKKRKKLHSYMCLIDKCLAIAAYNSYTAKHMVPKIQNGFHSFQGRSDPQIGGKVVNREGLRKMEERKKLHFD